MIKLDENNGCVIDDMYYDHEDISNMIRLQNCLFKEEKIIATIEQCINIWQNYSWDLCASWLDLPKEDTDILKKIKSSYKFDNFENYAK